MRIYLKHYLSINIWVYLCIQQFITHCPSWSYFSSPSPFRYYLGLMMLAKCSFVPKEMDMDQDPDLLNVTSITSRSGVRSSGLALIYFLNMRFFVLNYLFCPIFAFFLYTSSIESRENKFLKFC